MLLCRVYNSRKPWEQEVTLDLFLRGFTTTNHNIGVPETKQGNKTYGLYSPFLSHSELFQLYWGMMRYDRN